MFLQHRAPFFELLMNQEKPSAEIEMIVIDVLIGSIEYFVDTYSEVSDGERKTKKRKGRNKKQSKACVLL